MTTKKLRDPKVVPHLLLSDAEIKGFMIKFQEMGVFDQADLIKVMLTDFNNHLERETKANADTAERFKFLYQEFIQRK